MRRALEEEAKNVLPQDCTFKPILVTDLSKVRMRSLYGSLQGYDGCDIAERNELWKQQIEEKRERILKEREQQRLKEEAEERQRYAKESRAFRRLIAKVASAPRIRLDPEAITASQNLTRTSTLSAAAAAGGGGGGGGGGVFSPPPPAHEPAAAPMIPSPRHKSFFRPMDEGTFAAQVLRAGKERGAAFSSPVRGVVTGGGGGGDENVRAGRKTPTTTPRVR